MTVSDCGCVCACGGCGLMCRELKGAVFAVSMSRWGTQCVASLAPRFTINSVLRAFHIASASMDPRVIHEVR